MGFFFSFFKLRSRLYTFYPFPRATSALPNVTYTPVMKNDYLTVRDTLPVAGCMYIKTCPLSPLSCYQGSSVGVMNSELGSGDL